MVNYNEIINTLTINYLNVYVINPEENKVDVLKLEGYVTENLTKTSKDLNYTESLAAYVKGRVYFEDQSTLLEQLSPENLIKSFSNGEQQLEFSYRVPGKDGIHYYSAHYIRIPNTEDKLMLIAGFRNIDALVQKQTKERLEALYKGYTALSSIYLSMHRIDLKTGLFTEIKSNDKIRELTLKNGERIEVQLAHIMKHLTAPESLKTVLEFVDFSTLKERMKGHATIAQEFLGVINGWCKMRFIKEDEDENGDLYHIIYAVQVIHEEKAKELHLSYLAEIDSLTKILNRRSGEQKISELIKSKTNGLFCIIDCDHFKYINDTFGHSVGDEVLITVANCIHSVCRADDVVMRLGGDEFALYTSGITTKKLAENLFKRIVKAIEKTNIPSLGEYKIHISLGGAFFNSKKKLTFEELYQHADSNMYISKKTEGFKATF